jgi:hypothetical protein
MTALAILAEPTQGRDDRLQASAITALRASGYRALWNLLCTVRDGVIVVSGTVPSYFLKQKAQQALLALGCGSTVRNLLSVQRTPDRPVTAVLAS